MQVDWAIVSNLIFINLFLDIKVHTVLLLKLSMMMRLIQITKTIAARPQQPIAVLPDMKLDLILTKVNQKMPVQTTIKIKGTPTEQAEIQVQVKNLVQPFVLLVSVSVRSAVIHLQPNLYNLAYRIGNQRLSEQFLSRIGQFDNTFCLVVIFFPWQILRYLLTLYVSWIINR